MNLSLEKSTFEDVVFLYVFVMLKMVENGFLQFAHWKMQKVRILFLVYLNLSFEVCGEALLLYRANTSFQFCYWLNSTEYQAYSNILEP